MDSIRRRIEKLEGHRAGVILFIIEDESEAQARARQGADEQADVIIVHCYAEDIDL